MYNKNLNRWKLKRWYEVLLPGYIVVNNKVVGQIISHDESNLVGRTIKVAISDITQKMDEKSLYSSLILRTTQVVGSQVHTHVDGFEIAISYVKSLARSDSIRSVGKTIIHHVQDIKLKDGHKIRIKTFLVTPAKVSATVKRNLRKRLEIEVELALKDKSFTEFINSLIDDSLITHLRKELNRVNPVQYLLIKKFEHVR